MLIGFTRLPDKLLFIEHLTVGMGLAPSVCVSRGSRRFVS